MHKPVGWHSVLFGWAGDGPQDMSAASENESAALSMLVMCNVLPFSDDSQTETNEK